MNGPPRLKGLRKRPPRQRAGVVLLVMAALLAGCRSGSGLSAPGMTLGGAAPDLDAEIARASSLRKPLLILVAESGRSRADDHARSLFEHWMAQGEGGAFAPVFLDLGVSRNRAAAARFHVMDTPLLLGLTPAGLIVTRDQLPPAKDLVRARLEEVARLGRELDARLASLEATVARNPNDAAARLEIADFLLARQNAREAIPHLAAVARSEAVEPARRVRAWVELARAHLWIAEPEKGRHEAATLIAALGPTTAEALAGGNLVLGTQDANAKRIALARREFEAAVAAAPASDYGKQAAQALAQLPGEAK